MEENQAVSGLLAEDRPSVLYFWAPWCAPCRGMSPEIDRLSRIYQGRVTVRKVNVDEQPGLARERRVFGIPTLIVYRDGKVIARKTGALSALALESIFLAADRGGVISNQGLRPLDRWLRGLAGFALAAMGWAAGPVWIVIAAAGILLFSAVYDRCPVWRALTQGLKN